MVMIIIHIVYITCLVTNVACDAYDEIGFYKIHHGAGRISYYADRQYCGWLVRSWARSGPVTFNGASNTVFG